MTDSGDGGEGGGDELIKIRAISPLRSFKVRGGSRIRDWTGTYGERGVRANKGGLGIVPPAGPRGRVRGSGAIEAP